jgi:predicted DNA-binding transcriptional regulator
MSSSRHSALRPGIPCCLLIRTFGHSSNIWAYVLFLQVHKNRGDKEIAREVGLAQATVRNYLSNVYSKLTINDKAQLALLLSTNGGFG